MREFTTAGQAPEDKKELFNLRHSSIRNVVERTFGVYKRRWRIFDRPHEFKLPDQIRLVYALVMVHNFINTHYEVGDDFESFEPVDSELLEEDNNTIAEVEDGRRERIATLLWEQYIEARQVVNSG